MSLVVEHAEVWVAGIEDRAGSLANKLQALADAGADLEFIISRRAPDKPGTGVVFVTPVRGDREVDAATEAGFSVSSSLHSLRVVGDNQPGIAAELTRRIGAAGINLRGVSGCVIGTQFVLYLALDTAGDARKAMRILQAVS